MIISNNQISVFKEYGIRDFLSRATSHVYKNLADRVVNKNEQEIERCIISIVHRAHNFDLITEKQIVCLLDAEIIMGERFYEEKDNSWAIKILDSNKLSADEKSRLLLAIICSFDRENEIIR